MTVTTHRVVSNDIARNMLAALVQSGVTREQLAALTADLPEESDAAQFEYVVPVRDARANLKEMIDRAQEHPTLLTKRGKPVAAIVSADFYQRAVEALEDAHDLGAATHYDEQRAAGTFHGVSEDALDRMLDEADDNDEANNNNEADNALSEGQYQIIWSPEAAEQLVTMRRGSKKDVERIRTKVALLAMETKPPASKALIGAHWRGKRRLRVGDYRVIYEIHDDQLVIVVVEVGGRKSIYGGH